VEEIKLFCADLWKQYTRDADNVISGLRENRRQSDRRRALARLQTNLSATEIARGTLPASIRPCFVRRSTCAAKREETEAIEPAGDITGERYIGGRELDGTKSSTTSHA